jgi:hypothetical protein
MKSRQQLLSQLAGSDAYYAVNEESLLRSIYDVVNICFVMVVVPVHPIRTGPKKKTQLSFPLILSGTSVRISAIYTLGALYIGTQTMADFCKGNGLFQIMLRKLKKLKHIRDTFSVEDVILTSSYCSSYYCAIGIITLIFNHTTT